MSESMGDPKELVRQAHISQMKSIFKEPGQVGWSQEGLKRIESLYDLALKEDPTDPIGWIDSFNRSNPHHLEVGMEKSRIGKILTMAEIFVSQRAKKIEQRDELNRVKL